MSKWIKSVGTALFLTVPLAMTGSVQAAEKLNVVSWSGYFSPEILAKFQKQTGIEVTVRLDSGQHLAVVQADGGENFRSGERVRVLRDGATTRVTR